MTLSSEVRTKISQAVAQGSNLCRVQCFFECEYSCQFPMVFMAQFVGKLRSEALCMGSIRSIYVHFFIDPEH